MSNFTLAKISSYTVFPVTISGCYSWGTHLCLCRSGESLGVPSDRRGWFPLGMGILDLSTLMGMSSSLLPEKDDRYKSFSEAEDIQEVQKSNKYYNVYLIKKYISD